MKKNSCMFLLSDIYKEILQRSWEHRVKYHVFDNFSEPGSQIPYKVQPTVDKISLL